MSGKRRERGSEPEGWAEWRATTIVIDPGRCRPVEFSDPGEKPVEQGSRRQSRSSLLKRLQAAQGN